MKKNLMMKEFQLTVLSIMNLKLEWSILKSRNKIFHFPPLNKDYLLLSILQIMSHCQFHTIIHRNSIKVSLRHLRKYSLKLLLTSITKEKLQLNSLQKSSQQYKLQQTRLTLVMFTSRVKNLNIFGWKMVLRKLLAFVSKLTILSYLALIRKIR